MRCKSAHRRVLHKLEDRNLASKRISASGTLSTYLKDIRDHKLVYDRKACRKVGENKSTLGAQLRV